MDGELHGPFVDKRIVHKEGTYLHGKLHGDCVIKKGGGGCKISSYDNGELKAEKEISPSGRRVAEKKI